MKLRFSRSEADPNHCLKVLDDRPLIPAPSEDNLFLIGADPLICRINMMSSYMVEPHSIDAENLLRYPWGTISHGLRYTARDVKLHDYSNVDWVGSVEDRKSTSECWFSLGSASISWMSRKQKMVALSIAKIEYIATSVISCEAAWLWKLFNELFVHMMYTTMIFCVNQGGIRLLRNLVFYDCSNI
eukprot:PITA_01979